MLPSRTPNKSRFVEAATIYRDAMVPFIDDALGPDRIRSQLFNDEAKKLNEKKYEEGMRSLQQGTPVRNLIDHADIPFLIEKNLRHFSGLERADVNRMHSIRLLWNDKIKHLNDLGDFAPEDAAEYAAHCARVLRRCGLSADADATIGTSSSEATEAPAASTSDLREQRERREWDKARLAKKSPDELTPWEQQRRAEIEWEEEWERRELMRSEREEIAGFGDDVDGLRSWFDADKTRHDRHPSEQEALLQWEQERREQREREQRKREREQREQRKREYREWQRGKREYREWQRERTEIAAFSDDFDGLRRWFDADKVRSTRHASEYAALLRWEREQERKEWKRRERERREQGQLELGRRAIAAFGDDIDGLRSWFDADKARRDRHTSEYATLLQREQGRREQREREQRKREREERERQRERTEIAAFNDDFDGLRRWFDTDRARPTRHASEYAALLRREHERLEIAVFGGNVDALRRWFDTNTFRSKRHPSEYADLVRREQERREQQELERLVHEKAEIAGLGNDIAGFRRWFDSDKGRLHRHPSEYATLMRQERLERERAEIAAFGDDIDGLRRWFDTDKGRHQRHSSNHAALQQQLEQRRLRLEQERRLKRERREIAAFGDHVSGLRYWFDADQGRRQRHSSEYAALGQRGQTAYRGRREKNAREAAEREPRERERAEIATFGHDIDGLRRWFNADANRRQRHSYAYKTLVQREQQQTGSTAAGTSAAREQKQHRWPARPVDSKSRIGDAPPERGRSLLSRIFRR